MTAKQAEYVYSKSKKEVIGSEQVYECKDDDIPKIDSQLHPYECAMLNDFEFYNVPVVRAEIEKWSILNSKIDYVAYYRRNCH